MGDLSMQWRLNTQRLGALPAQVRRLGVRHLHGLAPFGYGFVLGIVIGFAFVTVVLSFGLAIGQVWAWAGG